jgi:hypothetical protein
LYLASLFDIFDDLFSSQHVDTLEAQARKVIDVFLKDVAKMYDLVFWKVPGEDRFKLVVHGFYESSDGADKDKPVKGCPDGMASVLDQAEPFLITFEVKPPDGYVHAIQRAQMYPAWVCRSQHVCACPAFQLEFTDLTRARACPPFPECLSKASRTRRRCISRPCGSVLSVS